MGFFRLFFVIIASIAVWLLCVNFTDFNYSIKIEVQEVVINTRLATIFSLSVFVGGLALWVISIFSSLMNRILNIGHVYRKQKMEDNVSRLIESALLLGVAEKSHAYNLACKIEESYLESSYSGYLDLIKAMSSAGATPISFYFYNKYPTLKAYAAKKLSEIELKIGNVEKALEYAKLYYNSDPENEHINLILAKIYTSMKQWRQMDYIISSLKHKEYPQDTRNEFSDLYLEAAKSSLRVQDNADSIDYATKALAENPANIGAAELFAEIATLNKNYDATKKVLINCFSYKPSFETFLLTRKFVNCSNLELYKDLAESCDTKEHISTFLAISTYMNLEDQQKELLDSVR